MFLGQEGFHRLLKCKSGMIRTYRDAHRSPRFRDLQFRRCDSRTSEEVHGRALIGIRRDDAQGRRLRRRRNGTCWLRIRIADVDLDQRRSA